MTEETTPPIEVNEEPTNEPTIPEPIEKLKKPSKKRVRETPPPKIKKVYNDRYKMGLLAEKLVEKIKPELKPDVKAEVKAEPLPLPEQMKITIKEVRILSIIALIKRGIALIITNSVDNSVTRVVEGTAVVLPSVTR